MSWGEKKQTRKQKNEGKAVAELKTKMADGGVMSGRKAARAAKAIREGRG